MTSTELYSFFIQPFIDYEFMLNALLAMSLAALLGPPLGVILIQKRLTLIGDSLSHALLPGVGIAFYFFGPNNGNLMLGAFITGIIVVSLSHWISKKSQIFEEASFAGVYLVSLAVGVVLISTKGSSADIVHLLFGQPLQTTPEQIRLLLIAALPIALLLWLFRRMLVLATIDPDFSKQQGVSPDLIHWLFMFGFVVYLVLTFQISGTLLTIGQMLLPALGARLWSRTIYQALLISFFIGLLSTYLGAIMSFNLDVPMSSSVLLTSALVFLFGTLLAPKKGMIWKWLKLRHFQH